MVGIAHELGPRGPLGHAGTAQAGLWEHVVQWLARGWAAGAARWKLRSGSCVASICPGARQQLQLWLAGSAALRQASLSREEQVGRAGHAAFSPCTWDPLPCAYGGSWCRVPGGWSAKKANAWPAGWDRILGLCSCVCDAGTMQGIHSSPELNVCSWAHPELQHLPTPCCFPARPVTATAASSAVQGTQHRLHRARGIRTLQCHLLQL